MYHVDYDEDEDRMAVRLRSYRPIGTLPLRYAGSMRRNVRPALYQMDGDHENDERPVGIVNPTFELSTGQLAEQIVDKDSGTRLDETVFQDQDLNSISTSDNNNLGTINVSLIEENIAVDLDRVIFYYGRGSSAEIVLKSVNMSVPRGTIYGLLGPSGCGKTTVIRTIVGSLKPQSGIVTVLGLEPGDPRGSVPGPGVGYMPQDIALYYDFRIKEMLRYFGRLLQVKWKTIEERMNFLLAFLDLPDRERKIGSLSGGQKRRVSLAVALIHKPPLLILDEPTVGVDPLLRKSIWLYLRTLSNQERITVIISTHYIEEARGADTIGLMRTGRILAECSPEDLLAQHCSKNIEEAFLKICNSSHEKAISEDGSEMTGDEEKAGSGPQSLQDQIDAIVAAAAAANKSPTKKTPKSPRVALKASKRYDMRWNEYFNVIFAVFWKSLMRNAKNPLALLFQFALPAFQVVLFCVCVGSDPYHVPVGVVNDEKCCLSERFLQLVDPYTIELHPYSDLEVAKEDTRRTKLWGVIHINEYFTDSIHTRLFYHDLNNEVTNETTAHLLDAEETLARADSFPVVTLTNSSSSSQLYPALNGSEIKVYADLTDRLTSVALTKSLDEAIVKLLKYALVESGANPAMSRPPLTIERAVYGDLTHDNHQWYTEYMAPGILLTMTYAMAVGMTSMTFILERRDGMLERTLVAGADTTQILVGHACTRIVLMLVQIILVLIVTFLVFAIPSRGPIIWAIVLLLLQNLTGMALGFVTASICRQEQTSTMISVGLLFVNLYIGGIIWPIEGMPIWLRWIAYAMPPTLPAESLRNILLRGWSITEPGVWIGYLVTLIWFIIFTFAASKIFRFFK